MEKLNRDFYLNNALVTAEKLIGKILVHNINGKVLKGRIVETEAYRGPFDKAAHSYNNKGRNGRTAIQYKEGGYAYVYLIYGMYYCFNVTTAPENEPECVLIRALEPLEGIEYMKELRNTDSIKNLCSGPGKLCKAMEIDKSCYGMDLCGNELYILSDDNDYSQYLGISKRINIDYAQECAEYMWRFYLKGNPYVSVKPK